MASVKAEQNPAGDYAIGVEVEGVFIPFVQVPAERIQHALERQQTLEERAAENDEQAQGVLDAEFGAKPAAEEKSGAKGGGR